MPVSFTRTMTLSFTLALSLFMVAATAGPKPVQVMIESKIADVPASDLKELGFDWLMMPVGEGDTVPQSGLPSPGIKIVETPFLDPILGAIEDSRNSDIISEPGVVVQQDTTSTIQSTTKQGPGLQLDVSPTVTGDDAIKLDLTVESVKTTVSIPAGQSVIIGGIIRERQVAAKSGIPVLGKIPYLGRLFGRSESKAEKRNLMIFMTPRLIGAGGSGGGRAPAAESEPEDSTATKSSSVDSSMGSAIGIGVGAPSLSDLGSYLPLEKWDLTAFGRGEISSTKLKFDSGSYTQNGQKMSFSGDDSDFDRNAVTAGARLGLPELRFVGNDIRPYLSAQLGYATLDIGDSQGDADPALSYGLSGGAYVDVLDKLRIYSDFTYRDDFKHDLSGSSAGGGSISGDVDLSMLRARLGVATVLGSWFATQSLLDRLVLYGGVDLTRQTAEINERVTYTDMYLGHAITQVVAAEFASTMLGVHGGFGYNFDKYGMVNLKLALAAGATLVYLEYDLWQWVLPRRCCVWPF